MNSVARRADQHITDAEFEELILGTLSPALRHALDDHLRSCSKCAQEFGDPHDMISVLPFAVGDPGDAFRAEAVWDAIAAQLPPVEQPTPVREITTAPSNVTPIRTARSRTPWQLLAAVAVISLVLGGVVGQVLPRFGEDEEDSQTFDVEFTKDQGGAAATLSYLPENEIFVFSVSGLPAPPDGFVYQAWLINEDGPIPTGTMGAGQEEMAAHGDKSQFTTFAITLEKGPLGSPTPTTEPIILANLNTQ